MFKEEKLGFDRCILNRLVEDYNEYSWLVSINHLQVPAGICDGSMLEWNRSRLSLIRDYLLEIMEKSHDVSLRWEYKEDFARIGDIDRRIVYPTVKVL